MKRAIRSEEQIIGILQEHEAGAKCADLCRKHGMWEGAFYAWKAKYSGMTVSEVSLARTRLREDRMRLCRKAQMADDADFNRDAAVQVAHAITTHGAQAEEDWYSAVDDLNKAEDTGAGHLGETAFGSGIYYQYVCVNCDLLIENLGGDKELAARGIEALAKALPQTAPAGKQSSFAHRPMAFYMRAEAGPRAPRDLSGAFFSPVERKLRELGANDLQRGSIKAMEQTAAQIDMCYYDGQAEKTCPPLNTLDGVGTLSEIVRFAGEAVRGA